MERLGGGVRRKDGEVNECEGVDTMRYYDEKQNTQKRSQGMGDEV